MSWREINKSPFSICTNEHKKHSGPPPRPFIKGYRSRKLCCMSHSDVFLETVPKPPSWPQKHTNIKIDNNIKELGNNERNVAYSVCSFVTLLPFIFMSHSDTDTQWLFRNECCWIDQKSIVWRHFNQSLWQFTWHMKYCIYIVIHIHVTQWHSHTVTFQKDNELFIFGMEMIFMAQYWL